ncbi:hypothetical protein Cgig2_032271 [Carnegiea gigantea]|uniref:Uncharacterized protein n=1 Tax=Carnegiea gigantea TaxID=171969 RepID=A0A9Q1JHE3_9CARY|nr:hypothetical protein Cgig2_032271 [Carnegiea gigantea]
MAIGEHAITLDVEEGEGFQVFHKLAVYMTNSEFARLLENDRGGTGSSHSGGGQQGSLMDEEWGMSSRSEYAPSETGSSTEDTVSMVDERCEAVGGSSGEGDDAEEVHADSPEGSGKGKSRQRRREPTIESRRWRRKAVGGKGFEGRSPASVRGSCTLEKICKFNKMLEPYQKEATTGTILKPTRVSSFFHVARVDSGTGEGVAATEESLQAYWEGRALLEKSDNLKSERGRKGPVFRNYIKVIKKLLDVNKEPEKLGLWLSLYAWRLMSGVMFPRTPYGAA